MARPKKIDTDEPKAKSGLSDAAKRALDFVESLNDEKAALLDDAKGNMVDFISSGSYAFNRMISGSYFKGYASNRLYALHGPSGCGKSLLAGCAAREAQKKGYQIIYYDTENAVDKMFLTRIGVDTDSLIIRTPETISEFRNMASNDMKKWREKFGDDAKLFMVCDSIGNLLGTKESNDIEEGKHASDMGQRAKEMRTCARALTNKCGHYNIPMVVINHSYEQAAANPHAAPTRKMSGGEGFIYACTGVISLTKKTIREDEKNAAGDNVKVAKGVILRARTDKNRVVPEGLSCEILLSFTKGLSKFYDLIVDGIEHGFFEKRTTRVYVKHLDKMFFEKQLYLKENSKDVWEGILQDLNKKVEESICYESLQKGDFDDVLEDTVENIEEETTEDSEKEN